MHVWQDQHNNMTCSAFAKWIKDSRPEADQVLVEIDEEIDTIIKCPRCYFKFILIRLVYIVIYLLFRFQAAENVNHKLYSCF